MPTRFAVLPITSRACAYVMKLPATYPKDPADRIVGATALVEGLALITADREIRRLKTVKTIWQERCGRTDETTWGHPGRVKDVPPAQIRHYL